MFNRTSGLMLAAAALALPLPAYADCAQRIAAIEENASVTSNAPSAGNGGSVQADGGTTEHQEGGPAQPTESWFTNSKSDGAGAVLTHLTDAREARAAGDEQACLEAVGQAEAALQRK